VRAEASTRENDLVTRVITVGSALVIAPYLVLISSERSGVVSRGVVVSEPGYCPVASRCALP